MRKPVNEKWQRLACASTKSDLNVFIVYTEQKTQTGYNQSVRNLGMLSHGSLSYPHDRFFFVVWLNLNRTNKILIK